MQKPRRYFTREIKVEDGEQLRITAGRRTLYVYVNRRGLNIDKGGYSRQKKRKGGS